MIKIHYIILFLSNSQSWIKRILVREFGASCQKAYLAIRIQSKKKSQHGIFIFTSDPFFKQEKDIQ
jgi:hypothetical protein